MSFEEKIKAIIDSNTYGINSPNGMEKFIGCGNSTIKNAIKENREPSIKVMKNLFHKLNINPSWWQTGEGPIYKDALSDRALWLLVLQQRDTIQLQKDLIAEQEKVNRLQGKMMDEINERNVLLESRYKQKSKPHDKEESKKAYG